MICIMNLFLFMVSYACLVAGKDLPKIGIIGGGIGGSAASYFLQDLFGKNRLRIDVYEYNRIGGRLATEKVKGNHYEVGGAVIHPRNKYMGDFVKLFGLKRRDGAGGDEASAFGLYDGEKFVFSETSGWPLLNIAKLLWRYGYDTLKLKYFIDEMLDHFSRIYTLQNEGTTFQTVEDMLFSMNEKFTEYLNVSSKVGFKENGFSDRVINELILATLLVNYGQTTDVHKFVGAVSVAGGTPGLWSVQGGNWQVAEKLVEAAKVSIVKAQVLSVTFIPANQNFRISYVGKSGTTEFQIYDIVILAAPVAENTKPNIKFVNFPTNFTFPGKYHQTVCTILKGDLKSAAFGMKKNQIQEILPINSSLVFNAIGKIYPVNAVKMPCDSCSAWKIFSREPLRSDELKMFFSNFEEVKSIPWLAYPHYDISFRSRKFVLHPNFYYVNAIEWAASAMEMSVIGAKNVALLAYKNWFKHDFNSSLKHEVKEEL